MPKIRIIGKLPKAALGLESGYSTFSGFNSTTTTTMAPKSNVPPNFIGPLAENQEYDSPDFNAIAPAPPGYKRNANGSLVVDPTFDEASIDRPLDPDAIPTISQDQLDKVMDQYAKEDKEAKKYLAGRTPPIKRFMKQLPSKISAKISDISEGKAVGVGNAAYKALMTADPFIELIANKKREKYFDKYTKQNALPDLSYPARPASMSGNRGDRDINTGLLRPNEIGFKSKGMYTNRFDYPSIGTAANYSFTKYGGSINNNPMQKVKIRILDKSGLEKMATGGQPMTYSGQLGYGINLGQKRIYTDMPPEKPDTLSGKLKPVPREQANLEAEVNETAWADVDGDGAREHTVIGGQKHSEGGTPLNLPEGSFIFSDSKDLKIKDPKILAKFNMPAKKGGYTPAEIAKKYDVNKYKAIIEDPNSDPIRKATAQIMVKTFQKKLAELALIQEQMKGFPQGIPEAVKEVMPDLQTREDRERQPGSSDTEVYEDDEEMEEEVPEEMGQPMMEYGGDAYSGGLIKFQNAGQNTPTPAPSASSYFQTVPITGQTTGTPVTGGTTPTDEVIDQTYTPKQKAPLNDPEFTRFMELIKKYDTGRYRTKGSYHVANLPFQDASEFARLATKFGFRRQAEGNVKGYSVIQGGTSDYTFTDKVNGKDVTVGFFTGFTPEMFEKRLVEDVYGKDVSDKMTDLERRKAYFKELGVDLTGVSDAKLSNSKLLYKDKNFFNSKFYPAFKTKFGEAEYRPEMGSIGQIGAEHYDGYKRRTKPTTGDTTVIGYKCIGRDATTGKANIQPSSYASTDAMVKDGAVASETEAYKQCPEKPVTPNPVGQGACPPGYYRNIKGECVKTPFDFLTPDKISLMAAMAVPPKLRMPWGQKLPFEPGDVVFQDFRARAAERQSLFNKMANQLNTYSPGRATASNLAFLAAQQSEGLVKDISDVEGYNVQVANAFGAQERQRKDQINMFNLAKAEQLYREGVIGKQAYDNAKRQYYTNYAKTYGNAWKNRMNFGLLNAVNPMFNIDPYRGQSWFKEGYGNEDLGNALFGSTASTGSASSLQDRVANYLKRGYTNEEARKAAIEEDKRGMGAGNSRQAQYNQMRSLLPSYNSLSFGSSFNPDEDS